MRRVSFITLHFKICLATVVCGAAVCGASPLAQSDVYARSIQVLGGSMADPRAYPQSAEGFQSYLKASGVTAIPARELIAPNHPEVAAGLGFQNFLPPREW